MTHFPKLKRRLRKLHLKQKGGHAHPAYQECSKDSKCYADVERLNAETQEAEDRQKAWNVKFTAAAAAMKWYSESGSSA